MIGTYIAIGIARAFAGMGTGGGGETTPTNHYARSISPNGRWLKYQWN